MKELGRIKVKNGWIIVNVDFLTLSEIVEDNSDWESLSPVKKKIPTIDVSISRRKAHRDKLKNRCERKDCDYLVLKKIMQLIEDWLIDTQPEYVYIGAIKDQAIKKRIIFYKKFFYRLGYKDYDKNYAIVQCVDDSISLYWLMQKDV